ncbi:protein kinase activating protein dpb11 [Neocucurbitaria cava]|uniref:Protein kinase activating protein dpb11 n=1 Tax=Neocucurbitaria cava TaxID=798079 RepID=A0A9W9CHC3_9PLEO|nr:protein kinase activating protein dpb11 [Neocucurbitaria cava]
MDATEGGYGGHDSLPVAGMHFQHAGTGQLPLAGAVICCTSIAPEQRNQLVTIGAQMGAAVKLDLTSDVTHLIVGSTDSAKYRYVAKSREDVKVLSPAWLEALREVWMEGDDNVDVAMLEREYRLPTFFGLKICLTGFDNPEQRRYIQETVDKNGAEYHGDLTKAVTHLIAATPSGKKYEHALNWRMKIVSLEWFEQSLERGMVLDEALYNPTIPVDQRGNGAWDRKQSPQPTLGKRPRDAGQNQSLNPFRRKLRRSASNKMGSQSEALWAGITAASSEVQHYGGDDWSEGMVAQPELTRAITPLTHTEDVNTPPDAQSPNVDLPSKEVAHVGLFQGRIVCPHGFDEGKAWFAGLTVNSTGFVGIELLHVTKLVTLMGTTMSALTSHESNVLTGATYDEQLTKKTSVMICNSRSPNAQKLKFASDKHIPAVHSTWLWECLRTGRLEPFGDYQIKTLEPVQQHRRKQTPDPLTSAPTAKLSEEDSLKLRQRKAQATKVTKPQRLQRPRALDLAPSTEATPGSSTNASPHPDHTPDQEEPAIGGLDGQASLPLQNVIANSPRRPSISSTGSKPISRPRSSSAESLIKAAPAPSKGRLNRQPTPDSVIPADDPEPPAPLIQAAPNNVEEEKDYSNILAQLRANRKAAPTPGDQADEKRRRRRQLGRATSARSNQSTGDNNSTGNLGGLDVDDGEDENTVLIEEYQPSQELGWDSPGAAKAREQMIRKLGGTIKERSVPVKGIGVVKDVVSETSGRAGGRKRRG